MPKTSKKLLIASPTVLSFWCPGCNSHHSILHGNEKSWTWNGDSERPTFSPSVLVKSGHYSDEHIPGEDCWCTYNENNPDPKYQCGICHSFVRDGKIQFLNDCTHDLAGQTVELPDLPQQGGGHS